MSMDRRTTIKWMFAAAAAVPSLRTLGAMPEPLARDLAAGQLGYGTDPELTKAWKPGGPWPLTLTESGRRTTQALCDLIIPPDEHSPAARPSASWTYRRVDQRALAEPGVAIATPLLSGLAGSTAKRTCVLAKDCGPRGEAEERHRRRHLFGGARQTQFAKAAKFFAKFRDLHCWRFLHHARRHEGHRVHGQCAVGQVRRPTARSAEEGRSGLKPRVGAALTMPAPPPTDPPG
jgi:hypothetical protein